MADPDRPEPSSLRGLSAEPSLSSGTGSPPAKTLQHDPWPTLLPSMRHSLVSRRSPHR
jgi:hypothetical protein